MTPSTEKWMTVAVPGTAALAALIAARRDPGPESFSVVTWRVWLAVTVAVDAPEGAAAVEKSDAPARAPVHAARQATPVIRSSPVEGCASSSQFRRRSLISTCEAPMSSGGSRTEGTEIDHAMTGRSLTGRSLTGRSLTGRSLRGRSLRGRSHTGRPPLPDDGVPWAAQRREPGGTPGLSRNCDRGANLTVATAPTGGKAEGSVDPGVRRPACAPGGVAEGRKDARTSCTRTRSPTHTRRTSCGPSGRSPKAWVGDPLPHQRRHRAPGLRYPRRGAAGRVPRACGPPTRTGWPARPDLDGRLAGHRPPARRPAGLGGAFDALRRGVRRGRGAAPRLRRRGVARTPSWPASSTVPLRQCVAAFDYLVQGGPANLEQPAAVRRRHGADGGRSGSTPPVVVPDHGVLRRPRARSAGRPTVAVVFYRAHLVAGNTRFVDELCDAIEAAGANALARVLLLAAQRRPRAASVTGRRAPRRARRRRRRHDRAGGRARTGGRRAPRLLGPGRAGRRSTSRSSRRCAPPSSSGRGPRRPTGCRPSTWPWRWPSPSSTAGSSRVPVLLQGGRSTTATTSARRSPRTGRVPDRVAPGGRARGRAGAAADDPGPAERRVALVLSAYPTKRSRLGNAVGLDTPASVLALLAALRPPATGSSGSPSGRRS